MAHKNRDQEEDQGGKHLVAWFYLGAVHACGARGMFVYAVCVLMWVGIFAMS